MRGLFLFAAACLALPGAALSAKPDDEQPEAIQPSSSWHLDMADEKCRLARQFGEGKNRYVLVIEQDKPNSWASISIAGSAMDRLKRSKSVFLQFGGLEPVELESWNAGTFGEYGAALLLHGVRLNEKTDEEEDETEDEFFYLPKIETARYDGVEAISVVQQDKTVLALAADDLGPAFAALNVCTQDMISHWGLDLEKHRKMRRRVEFTNLLQVARRIQKTYPVAAVRSGEQGTVRFVAIVDEKGDMVECRQSDATEMDDLKSPACRELRRAKFLPALDAEGKPMKSYYATHIRYVMP